MTTETTGDRPQRVHVEDVFHALHAGLTISLSPGQGVVTARGAEFEVTPAMLTAARRPDGSLGWLDLLDDEDAQVRRWGRLMLARGPAPDDLTPWDPESATERAEAREAARKAAWALDDEDERRKALEDVWAVYGPPRPTSTTTAHYDGDEDMARRRDAQIAAERRFRGRRRT